MIRQSRYFFSAQAVCRICQMGMVCRHAEDLLPLLRIIAGPPDPQEEWAWAWPEKM